MVDGPETRYASSASGEEVAYQVVGDGPLDILVTRFSWFSIEQMWDEPRIVHFLHRLSSFSRHIWFDYRGTGASDAIPPPQRRLLETMVEDMVTVLDDVGCERVVVLALGISPGLLFAATYPERTVATVLVNISARFRGADDYPQGWTEDEAEFAFQSLARQTVEPVAPSLVGDEQFRRWFERSGRLMIPPHDRLVRLRTLFDQDVRGVLGSVQSPSLVLFRRGAPQAAQYRYVAEHVPDAEVVELDGADTLPFVDEEPLLDAIEKFVTGELPEPESDRVLVTVLFTDVVSSTPQVAQMGDRRWRNLLATHDALVRSELDRFRGRAIKSMGDGVLATFDGPARAIRCACAIRDTLHALGLEIRAGLHTGEIELCGDDIAGIAVNISERVTAHAEPGEVLVSRTVADLVAGSDVELEERGRHELKGVPGTWRLYRVAHV
jgi:class 3 adenylate cyclase